ncbi:squalene--hopene cyclase [Roseiconus nitratireducens]|uniref:Squalene--hopene cyclase n=1 Tax=Roseiconus nitratireducens TaxID=2605748 RepID=A0A5M6CYB0_9BACT|nr:prenyltransferase/squalene oxidase repeat-containing protein [Roseiconus nitratireducens]KAA5540194.1 squalene--hopene cyclase [Roseiconus nitratireducens]
MTTRTQIDSRQQVRQRARQTLDQVRQELLQARHDSGHWTGQLASSALSTATAVSAFAAVVLNRAPGVGPNDDAELRAMVGRGIAHLRTQQNGDGGFGDTDRSHSNVATSYLVLAASTLAGKIGQATLDDAQIDQLNAYLDRAGRLDGLKRRYGKDKTFVVPIMNNLAIAGLISWDDVAALPFEAAVFPQSMYRFLRMPVVSYAIPALVAIGQARHFLGRRALLPLRLIRTLSVDRTLRVLRNMQPESGGYLEATPLTAFVVMSLAATGRCDLEVVQQALRFLRTSMLPDGSWPIDTNLATWVTSLAIGALTSDPEDDGAWYSDALARWHLDCQHRQRHPFTGAEPGGWGWTDLSGAVPDSDDTPAALLAIDRMKRFAGPSTRNAMSDATRAGVRWLLRLQNRNGGWPTFCRGWGKLPFDRSSTDLTAHALRAIEVATRGGAETALGRAGGRASRKGIHFLVHQQHADGSFLPLWFGNQDHPEESNPIYGTAKVLISGKLPPRDQRAAKEFLLGCQNPDGGWGGGPSVGEKIRQLTETDQAIADLQPRIPSGLVSSVEESALAVEALATVVLLERGAGERDAVNCGPDRNTPERSLGDDSRSASAPSDPTGRVAGTTAGNAAVDAAILRGVDFLSLSVADRRHHVAWPIGFYFAKLWYHEQLYPLIFTAAALGKFLRATDPVYDADWPK